MPTFIKPGFWEKAKKGYRDWLNLDDLIAAKPSGSGTPIFQPDVIYFGGTTAAGILVSPGITNSGIFWSREISAPNLITLTGSMFLDGSFGFGNDPILERISMPSLETIGSLIQGTVNEVINIYDFQYLTTIDFSSLRTLYSSGIYISANPQLTTLNLQSLETVPANYIQIQNNPSLTTLSFPSLTTCNADIFLTDNALDQQSVDGILYQLANVVNLQNQAVSLSGGTNAAPSVAAAAYIATLVANGCTVTTN